VNRNYRFSKSSNNHIEKLAPQLQTICHEGLIIANTRKVYCPDFSIVRSFETASGQFELFKKGRAEFIKPESDQVEFVVVHESSVVTNCDGYKKISDHQKTDINGKALAFDFAAWINGSNYEDQNMALIATCFFEAASNNGFVIDWGGNYRSISDGSHISLVV
jgi:hypothetical protein